MRRYISRHHNVGVRLLYNRALPKGKRITDKLIFERPGRHSFGGFLFNPGDNMRRLLLALGLFMVPFSAMAILGGKDPGEECSTSDDVLGQESSECHTGSVCVFSTSRNRGVCFPDCTYIENTSDIKQWVMQTLQWDVGENNIISCSCTDTVDFDASQLSTRYRCVLGYYGRPTNSTSGCTKCPGDGVTITDEYSGLLGGLSATSCILRDGGTARDTSGTFTVTADCPWME